MSWWVYIIIIAVIGIVTFIYFSNASSNSDTTTTTDPLTGNTVVTTTPRSSSKVSGFPQNGALPVTLNDAQIIQLDPNATQAQQDAANTILMNNTANQANAGTGAPMFG